MRFNEVDRQVLLQTPNIGPTMVRHLEALGLSSLAELGRIGVEGAIGMAADAQSRAVLKCRRRALRAAIASSRSVARQVADPR